MIKVLTPIVGVLFLLLISSLSRGESTSRSQFFKQYEDSFMQLVEPGSELDGQKESHYPWILRVLFEGVLSEDPNGQAHQFSADCSPQWLSRRLLDPRLKELPFQAGLIQKYFRECDGEISTGIKSSLRHTLKTLSLEYNFRENSFIQKVVFQFEKGIRLKGLLALKKDGRPRPLVVLRLGVYASVEEFLAERYLVMQLFDQSPFNLLVLENITSPDFITNNLNFSLGGLDEGLQNIAIAKYLRNPKTALSKIVQSLHFTGVSLGGHGVLFASYLNSEFSKPKKPLINSFLLLCPVVHLRPTFENLTSDKFSSRMIDVWSEHRLSVLKKRMTDLDTSDGFLKAVLKRLEARYQGPMIGGVKELPKNFKTEKTFWELNDFAANYKNDVAPVLSLVTDTDQVVPPSLNSFRFKHKNFRVVRLAQGEHCSLSSAYKWDVITTVVQSYILAQSPNFKLNTMTFPIQIKRSVKSQPLKVEYEVESKDQSYVVVKVSGAVEEQTLHLPLSGFGYNLEFSPSDAEKSMFKRWLNHNVKYNLVGENLRISWQL